MVLLVLLLLTAVHLSAEEEVDFSLVNQTKSPISRVAGSVNIVSGDWVDQFIHHETSGPDPYVVAHSYISSSLEEGTLADGWDFYHPSELEVFQPKGITYNRKGIGAVPLSCWLQAKGHHATPYQPTNDILPPPDEGNKTTLFYREAGGGTVVFKKEGQYSSFAPKLKKTGYMVVSSIDHPARRDVKRTRIRWEAAADRWVVTLGDGTRRIYSRTDTHQHRPRPDQKRYYRRCYHVSEEFLPSGNRRQYHYDPDKELKTILTVSSDEKYVIHSVAFHRKKDEVEVVTSDGLTTRFLLKKQGKDNAAHVVRAVDRAGRGRLSYSYADDTSHHLQKIQRRKSSAGRHDEVKFYRSGKNTVGEETVTVAGKKKKKFMNGRVREVWTKALPGHPLALRYAFAYKQGDDHSVAKVSDPGGGTLVYFWEKDDRPNWIGLKNLSGALLHAEHFVWGREDDEGRLLRRTWLDESKKPLLDREFSYNAQGDVVKETLRGIFTGRPHRPLRFDGAKAVHGGEVFSWEAQYSDDGRSLKTAQKDPLGNWTYYKYDAKRQLLTARFTCDQDRIIKREFFTYDTSGICIEAVVDDGSSRRPSEIGDISRRTIHRIIPRYQVPFFGASNEEQWLVYTPEFGEQLVRTERYMRDIQGRPIVKELLDGFGVVQKRWTYAYDELHRLVSSSDPSGAVERFSYDDAGHVAVHETPEAAVAFSYDLFDRVVEEKKRFSDLSAESLCRQYDLSGRVATTIDARGRETTTVLDLGGRMVKKTLPRLATEEGVQRPEISWSYAGSTERCRSPSGAVTQITRSATGKPLVTVTAGGATTHCYYDARNRLLEQCDGSGLVTMYEYDALDRVTKIEQKIDGQTISMVTKKYRGFDLVEERFPTKVTNYSYDSLGRRVQETVTDLLTNESVTTRTVYDALHRPICIYHDAVGTEEHLSYDLADRIIEQRVVGAEGTVVSITTKAYDLAGRVVEEGVGRAGTIARTVTTYGAYGLPSSTIYPDGTITHFSYDPFFLWTDGHRYLRKVTVDARGVATEELVDSNDQVRFRIIKDPFGSILSKRTVVFSILGKPTLIEEEAIAAGFESSCVKTRLEYDAVGQLTACTLAAGTEDAATWRYRYDQEGRKIQEIKPSGEVLSTSYDVKGRVSSFSSSDGSIYWQYSYNSQDLPEVISNCLSGAVTMRRYNGLGMMVEETVETGLTLSYDMAPSGLLKSITYPDASRATYAYANGRISNIKRGGYIYEVRSRDLSGLITEALLPGGAGQVTASVDEMGRRRTVDHAAFSESRTSYDPAGCCLERTVDGKRETFSYDFLCQLISENGKTSVFDSLYRRRAIEGTPVIFNARHQICSQRGHVFRYDVDGRRVADSRFRYSYDALDRLTAVEDDSTRCEYAYDSFHRRLSATTSIKENGRWQTVSYERYLWQKDCEVGSVDDKGRITSLRVLGEGLGGEIGSAVLMEVAGETYIPLHDLSGHVRACLSVSGEVVEKLFYTAFGLDSRTAALSPWTFSSKRQDQLTGLCFFGRRFYDPFSAVWLTQDPLGHVAGPNLYAYVKNNPLTTVDVFGLIDRPESLGFFEGVWDACREFFHGIFGGGQEGGQTPESSVEAPIPSESSNRHEETPPIKLRNGSEIETGRRYSDMVLIYPHGSVDEFISEYRGENLGARVIGEINGVNTSLYDCCRRAEEIMDKFHQIVAVIICYNSTEGLFKDSIEAIKNFVGLETAVSESLRNSLFSFFDACKANDIEFRADFFCHSQGVPIGDRLLHSSEFSGPRSSIMYINKVINFGGPKICPGSMNYIAIGDPIPLLCLTNIFVVINAFANGEIAFACPSTVEFPHNFSGSAYQTALEQYMNQKGE